jgi:hypothetical protein
MPELNSAAPGLRTLMDTIVHKACKVSRCKRYRRYADRASKMLLMFPAPSGDKISIYVTSAT